MSIAPTALAPTADPFYCFASKPSEVACPECGHGIDPHGFDPGGPCGVGDENRVPCPCVMQPSGIAQALLARAASGS